MFNIESGVKLPRISRAGRKAIYPFLDMKKGNSFFVPLNGREPKAVLSTVSSAGRSALGKGFVSARKVKEDGVDGVRVWRIK